MVQTKSLSRKQRSEQAVAYALEQRWDLAADENRALLADDGGDAEAANRLGKALTELGDLGNAAAAYEQALAVDATNAIARKNLSRINDLKGGGKRAGRGAATKRRVPADLRAHTLIEESAKSAEFELLQPSSRGLQRVTAGDAATLEPTEHGVVVKSETGAALGTIDARAGLRLKRMMEGGNRYAALIRRVADGEATVFIREMHTDPSLAGQASFIAPPSPTKRRQPRAYTKASVVRHEQEAADPDDGDGDAQDGARAGSAAAGAEQADEMKERGFTEKAPDEELEDEEEDEDRDEGEDEED